MKELKRIHFIAIGGSAMHSLALALHRKGLDISGSDDAIYSPSREALKAQNLLPETMGWFPDKIRPDLDAVVLGMHARPDNPELSRAQELGIPIYSYPEFIAQLSQHQTRVVIGGSHGKTTITAMVLHVLKQYDIQVDYLVGAAVQDYKYTVELSGTTDFIILEGDEYLSSPIDLRSKFLWYTPQIALLSGMAWDHVNVFPTEDAYRDTFDAFIHSITPGGVLVYQESDQELVEMVEAHPNTIRKEPYGQAQTQQLQGQTFLQTDEGPVPLQVFGAHNMQNLEGARWICQLMGVDMEDFHVAISSFRGARGRLELLSAGKSAKLFRDFAHAPSKVKATSLAVAEQFQKNSLVAGLELHTFSSLTEAFLKEYQNTLQPAQEAFVYYDPEALKQKNRPAIAPEVIQQAFNHPNLNVFTSRASLEQFIETQRVEKKIYLLMSSGTFGGTSFEGLKEKIKAS